VTDIKNIFSSVIDLFIGIATLDGKKIWAALKTGASSFGEFFLHTITGGINLLVNFVADLFGVKMEGSFDILSSDTVKKLVGVLTDFGNTIVDWVKGLARATIELLPGGEKMANRIFGEREFTEDDVEDKAKDIAIERTKSGMTTSERYGLSRSGGVPKYTITDADRAQALKELAPKGKITPKDVKSLEGDDLLNRIEKLLQTNTNEKGVQINDNRTNTTINGGGRGASTVSVVPRTEKASFSNPIRR
jgi:hypothetical protein